MILLETIQKRMPKLSADEIQQITEILKKDIIKPDDALFLMKKVLNLSDNRQMAHTIIARAGKVVRDTILLTPCSLCSAEKRAIMRRAGHFLTSLSFEGIPLRQCRMEINNLASFMENDDSFQKLKDKYFPPKRYIPPSRGD